MKNTIKTIRKNSFKLIVGACIIILTVMIFQYPSNAEVKSYKFVGDKNHPPYEYIDENGKYKGFNVDIIKAISHVTGLEIELELVEWEEAIKALDNKDVDGIIGISKNEDRMKKYLFTNPTVINEQVIFTRVETVHINELLDLQGLKVGYQKNDYNESTVLDIPNVIPVPKENQTLALIDLYNGEVDAVVINKLVGLYNLQKMNLLDYIKIVGSPLISVDYGLAVTSENLELYDEIKSGLNKIKINGTYESIYRKWFRDDSKLVNLIYDSYKIPILIVIILIILTFLVLYLYNKKLEKDIKKRTKELEEANENLIKNQKEIYNLAYYDNITELPNRIYFKKQLDNLYRRKEKCFAVLVLDIDRFKDINDNLSHSVGDFILKTLGQRLELVVGYENLVARTGEDEYFILIKNIKDHESLKEIVDNVILDFKNPYILEKHSLHLSTSIGVAIYPQGGEDSDDIIRNASLAMYKAKQQGGNNYYIYSGDLETTGLDRMIMLSQLRQAVDKNEFILHYQPQIDINTKELTGVEALVRWNHPEKGLIYPDKFIKLAEESWIIIQLGKWILEKAVTQCKKWIDSGYDLKVSINISAKQFQIDGFLEDVIEILEKTNIDPKNIILEITETIAITDINHTLETLAKLEEIGILVAIDDFGTGYSSLSYLNEMKVSELKIDRSFIWDLENNEKHKMISTTIIMLAKKLGFKVTAEGVETEAQLNLLKEMKCDTAQGYFISKPVTVEKINEMLQKK